MPGIAFWQPHCYDGITGKGSWPDLLGRAAEAGFSMKTEQISCMEERDFLFSICKNSRKGEIMEIKRKDSVGYCISDQISDQREEIRKKAAFVAPDADLYGDVTAGEDTSFWFHAVVRADDAPVLIGRGSNIQDNAVVHVDEGFPVHIGEDVTVGHGAIVHGCTIGDRTLIGMGAVILNGAVIGSDCVIGAGALVTGKSVIPDGSMVLGSPAVVRRPVTEEEKTASLKNARHYVEEGKKYAAFFRKEN